MTTSGNEREIEKHVVGEDAMYLGTGPDNEVRKVPFYNYSRAVEAPKCTCFVKKHFETTDESVCIRNLKPFSVKHDESTLKTINDNLLKAVHTVFDKLSGSSANNQSDDED